MMTRIIWNLLGLRVDDYAVTEESLSDDRMNKSDDVGGLKAVDDGRIQRGGDDDQRGGDDDQHGRDDDQRGGDDHLL